MQYSNSHSCEVKSIFLYFPMSNQTKEQGVPHESDQGYILKQN